MNTPSKQKNKSVKPKGYEADYNYLNRQHMEIQQLRASESIMYQANYSYYERWLRNNQKELTKMFTLRTEIDKGFFQHTEVDGKIEYAYEGEKKEGLPLFLEGKTNEDFQEACKLLGQHKCIVIP
jgi:hypothetical protein